MKRILLLSFSLASISFTQAQKNSEKTTAYAITGVQKGSSNWTEVRLVDITTGEEIQSVYKSADAVPILNARSGKPVKKRTNLQLEVIAEKPFATNSAACAYDKKHNRLYYTPMGIAQLRYIDLKEKAQKVFYFEEEAFGVVKGRGDVGSQITRMVIASDGKGYALSNDANHLIQFATKKKQEIIDLGALTDDAANGKFSVHSSSSYGGDIIADKNKNIYLIGANRVVFKISLETKVATYLGAIKNLPRGYSTNGAIAQGDSKVIVSSSNSTGAYYRFDLNTLEAEKVSSGSSVFNASDLANGALAFEKKDPKETKQEVVATETPLIKKLPTEEGIGRNAISVYPNPVTDGYFKLSFSDQTPGRYQVQLMDISGKIFSTQFVNVANKMQVEEFRVPQKTAPGNYLVKVMNEAGTYTNVNKVIIQ